MVRLVVEADTQPPAGAGLTEVLEVASRLLPPASQCSELAGLELEVTHLSGRASNEGPHEGS